MNACRGFRKKLSAYLDGEISAKDRAGLEKHLHACPGCQKEIDALSGLRLRLGEVEELPSAPHLWPAVLAAVSPIRREKWSFSLSSLREFKPVTVAAAALIVVAVGIWAGSILGNRMYQRVVEGSPSLPPRIDYLSVFDELPAGSAGQAFIESAALESNGPGGARI